MHNISSEKYDYIITGAGCAGLSLVAHFIASGKFSDKKILLIDKAPKTENDRTWCFWEIKPGLFEPIVHRQWQQVWFHTEEFSKLFNISPYRYKMIRGIDFYRHCFDLIAKHSHIEVLYEPVQEIDHAETSVTAGGKKYYASYIFNSILFQPPSLKQHEIFLQQHFKGWLIETDQPVFNEAQATLMDFRVSQQHGTTFAYVLPLSPNTAMVEYTLFTKDLLQSDQYDEGLKNYISSFTGTQQYTIKEVEWGVIPMTNHVFSRGSRNVINIGSAGGQTKPSSGYTFYFIQQHSRAIADAIIKTGKPFVPPVHSKKFIYYDSVLLNVLATGKMKGSKVFANMFRGNSAVSILQFLNNESSLGTDLKIITSLPFRPFLLAGIQQL
ncbi:MAG TPA: lycopene cyclase family protein [Chitinophagaceae bacterium]|nr:lycopene cyclase family protein [Chitinophagaceae bacterium]